MYHDLPRSARFWSFLLAVDQDLAEEETHRKACPCGGHLHSANYPRKPRGTRFQLPERECLRLSFCCNRDGCRKRVTPPSVRFLGPKVYLGAIVILISAMRQGPSPRRVRKLSTHFGADRRTIARWQVFCARTLSPDAVLEDRTCPPGAYRRARQPAVLVGGCLSPPPPTSRGLDAPAEVSFTDHGPRGPANRGLAMSAFQPAEDARRRF